MSTPRDTWKVPVQALHPVDDGAHAIAATNGASVRNAAAFKAQSIAVMVRVRSGAIRYRFGDGAVVAAAGDHALTVDDGWITFSLDANGGDGAVTRRTHIACRGDGADAQVQVSELS